MATDPKITAGDVRGEVSCSLEEIAALTAVHTCVTHPARIKMLREIEGIARNALAMAA